MNPKNSFGNRPYHQFGRNAITGIVALLLLLSLKAVAGGVVTECTEASLRAALVGGGTVTFACDGTIILASTITNTVDTLLDGAGHQVTISGSNAVRVFYVTTNVVFALANLTVANGWATNGAGILNAGGMVNITNCVFSGNRAEGSAGPNNPPHGPPGQDGCGGALDNAGIINAVGCTFIGNSATGGRGGAAANVYIYGQFPGNGGWGGAGTGGAVHNTGLFVALGCTFSSNVATGGVGGAGSQIAIYTYSIPMNGGNGGSGGSGKGGAVFSSGAAHLINCGLAFNAGTGAAGGSGGVGSQGAPGYPNGMRGADGSPGSGFGGIDDASGQCQLINCTLAFNSGTGGSPKGGIATSGATMINTLLAENTPGGNGSSAIVDLGHNLSSDNSCAFTNLGSLNNTNPKLGPLANNGGPTMTMALLPGSPAIDGGDDASAPTTDQRGFPRPVAAAADIGAFEYGSPALLRITRSSETDVEIFVLGVKTQWCRLFTSATLSNWQCVATNQIGPDGTVLFQDSCATGETQRFYKVALP